MRLPGQNHGKTIVKVRNYERIGPLQSAKPQHDTNLPVLIWFATD